MTSSPKYDFTQHFITCGRWKKVFDGLVRQIVQVWGVENVEVEETVVMHYGTVTRLYPDHTHLAPMTFSCEEGSVPCVIIRDVDVSNREFKKACKEVFCRHFPVEWTEDTDPLLLQKETLCFILKFYTRNSFFLLLVPCKPFKLWKKILDTFAYTSNCKADLSKERLSARHIDLQKMQMEIKAYLQHSLCAEELKVGHVITTQYSIDHPIDVGINGNENFYGTIGQSGGKKCIFLHKETAQ